MNRSRVRELTLFVVALGAILIPACKPIVGPAPPPPIAPPPGGMPVGVVNRGYNYDLASNITTKGAATFIISSGNLPAGMNLAGQGVFSGVPGNVGRFNFIVDVTDINGTVSVGLTLDIVPELNLANAALPNGFLGIPYSQNLVVTGGLPAYTTMVVDPAADAPGLDITVPGPADATYEGIPSLSGVFTFDVTITDSGNQAVLPSGITVQVTIAILGFPSAYVTNAGDGTVSVINLQTNGAISIPGVGNSPQGIALSPNGATVYVTNYADNEVVRINAITNSLFGTPIAVGAGPKGIVAPNNSTLLYVANENDNTISIIDVGPATPTSAGTIDLDGAFPGAKPQRLAASLDGRLIYLTLSNVFDLSDPAQPVQVPDKLVVISNNPGSPDFHSILALVDVGEGPSGIAFSPSSNLLIIASELSGEVYFIGVDQVGLSFSEKAVISNLGDPKFVGVGADCNHVYVSRSGANAVSPIDVNWDIARPQISASAGPAGISFNPDGNIMYVALSASNQVLAYNLDTKMVQATITVGATPTAIVAQTNPTFRIRPLLSAGDLMPKGSFDVEYRSRVCAAGGASPYTFTELDGTLPPGLSLDSTGLVSGTPTDASLPDFPGLWIFGVEVTDGSPNPLKITESLNLKLQVCCLGDPRLLYVANFGDDTVSAIELVTDSIVTDITQSIGPNPLGVAISPNLLEAYVTNFNGGGPSTVSVIDLDPNSLTYNAVIGIVGVGQGASGVVFHPSGSFAYVSNQTDATISVIDTAARPRLVISTPTVGLSPQGMATNQDGSRLYVANLFGNTVSVINTATRTLIATVLVGSGPVGVAYDDLTGFLYVTNQFDDTVTYIETVTNTVVGTIGVGNFPTGIVMGGGNSHRAYVANQLENTVSVIDLNTNTELDLDLTTIPIERITVGTSPDFLTAISVYVYVTNFGSGNVSRILNLPGSPDDNTETGTITVGTNPEGIKFPGGN